MIWLILIGVSVGVAVGATFAAAIRWYEQEVEKDEGVRR